jgi:hypothetical protein
MQGVYQNCKADALGIAMPVGRGPENWRVGSAEGLGTKLEVFTFKFFRKHQIEEFWCFRCSGPKNHKALGTVGRTLT